MAKALVMVLALLVGTVTLGLTHRTIAETNEDPSGRYVAEVSYRTFYTFLPRAPGDSSGKPAFVEIFDKEQHRSMGRIPVSMLVNAVVEWEPTGASVISEGEWDFARGSCYYWDESQNHKIFVRGHE